VAAAAARRTCPRRGCSAAGTLCLAAPLHGVQQRAGRERGMQAAAQVQPPAAQLRTCLAPAWHPGGEGRGPARRQPAGGGSSAGAGAGRRCGVLLLGRVWRGRQAPAQASQPSPPAGGCCRRPPGWLRQPTRSRSRWRAAWTAQLRGKAKGKHERVRSSGSVGGAAAGGCGGPRWACRRPAWETDPVALEGAWAALGASGGLAAARARARRRGRPVPVSASKGCVKASCRRALLCPARVLPGAPRQGALLVGLVVRRRPWSGRVGRVGGRGCATAGSGCRWIGASLSYETSVRRRT
jgi:hypothetical protein